MTTEGEVFFESENMGKTTTGRPQNKVSRENDLALEAIRRDPYSNGNFGIFLLSSLLSS